MTITDVRTSRGEDGLELNGYGREANSSRRGTQIRANVSCRMHRNVGWGSKTAEEVIRID